MWNPAEQCFGIRTLDLQLFLCSFLLVLQHFFFPENLTLHERQVHMKKSFSFVHHNLSRVN